MQEYVEKLIEMINYERKAESTMMIDEIKRMSASKREELGRAITKVKGRFLGKELGMNIVQYGRSQRIDTEISVGDVVLISTDNPLKSDLTATVIERGARYIKLSFDSNVPKWALKKKVRLDLYFNDITYKRMEDNLKNLTLKGRNALAYHLEEKNPKKAGRDVYIEYIDKSLNESQKAAIKNSLSSPDFYIIHGPFGTGKTRTLIELICQEHRQNHKILATAESNAATDNILERLSVYDNINITRLGNPQRVSQKNIKYTLAYKVENHENKKYVDENNKIISQLIEKRNEYTKPSPRYKRGLSDSQIKQLASRGKSSRGVSSKKIKSMAQWIEVNDEISRYKRKADKIEEEIIDEIVEASDVIVSTNSSAAMDSVAKTKFDVAVIDEASQTTIPSVLIPIAKAHRFILAGDHKQLPPTVISDKASMLQDTLFESLIRKYSFKSSMLNKQYRMNDTLMQFSNRQFYDNKLHSHVDVKDITLSDIVPDSLEDALTFIDTSNVEDNSERHLKDSKSLVNTLEVSICLEVANHYLEMGLNEEDIGIISPYSDQAKVISEKTSVESKTVDGFQGREKEVIIISTVRSNEDGRIGFLKDLRRLNVAITRAKRKLVIIGNADTLKSDDTYRELVEFTISQGSIKHVSIDENNNIKIC